MRRTLLLVPGAALTLVALAACSTGSSKSANGDAAGGGVAEQNAVAKAPDLAMGSADHTNTSAVRDDAAPLTLGASEIRTATMTVAIKGASNVALEANKAEDVVGSVGGEVDSDDRTSGKQATATLRLLVPPDRLRDVLTQLSGLGTEKTRSSSTQDVTTKVADVDSRVASAQQAIDRLRTLYGKAAKVRDVISIESELSGREADLESLQAQQRALARKTSMATITLQLITARKHVAHHAAAKHRGGFLGGLDRGWDAFRSTAGWVATALGAVLPFLLVVLVLALGARLLWPRTRRPVPAAPSAPAE